MILSTTSGIRYAEHENLNSYRNFPFSETADLSCGDSVYFPADVFVDASLYPVVESASGLRLAYVDYASGVVSVVDENGTEITGKESGGVVELNDALGRHAGSIVCGRGWARESPTGRRLEPEGAWFSPSVCCPVVHTGVISMSDEDRTWRTTRRDIALEGDGWITPVLSETPNGPELRFDAQYTPPPSGRRLVNQIVFACVGKTIFSMADLGGGDVELAAPPLDRDDICWQAHREDAVAVVADACEREGEGGDSCDVPDIQTRSQRADVCPSDSGNISLFSDDAIGYRNPIKVSTVQGSFTPRRPNITSGMSFDEIVKEGGKAMERPLSVGNGIRISIPGVSNV